jgi:hypothetical protein
MVSDRSSIPPGLANCTESLFSSYAIAPLGTLGAKLIGEVITPR